MSGEDRFLELVERAVEEPGGERRRTLWEAALAAAGDDPLRTALALSQLGVQDVAEGAIELGAQRFDQALELAPEAPFVYRSAADALRGAGSDEAADIWEQAGAETLAREVRTSGAALTVPWHPADLWDEAVAAGVVPERLQAATHLEYCHLVDRNARALVGDGLRVVGVRPIGTRDDTVGEPIPWPPARNDDCWCGSGQKYKRCCGRR